MNDTNALESQLPLASLQLVVAHAAVSTKKPENDHAKLSKYISCVITLVLTGAPSISKLVISDQLHDCVALSIRPVTGIIVETLPEASVKKSANPIFGCITQSSKVAHTKNIFFIILFIYY